MNDPSSTPEAFVPPAGFRPLLVGDGFIAHNGPVYIKDEEELVFGFRVLPHHCNPIGLCHGGWLATAMDMVLPLTGRLRGDAANTFLLTVHMSIDYLGAARLGDWVEGRARVLRRTKRMIFVEGGLEIDGELCTRGSGVFRIGPEAGPIRF